MNVRCHEELEEKKLRNFLHEKNVGSAFLRVLIGFEIDQNFSNWVVYFRYLSYFEWASRSKSDTEG